MSKVLILDIGGSCIKIAVIQENKITYSDKEITPTDLLEKEFLDTMEQIVHKLKPDGIALSIPRYS